MKLTGHIDEITLFHVAGWAADLDEPAREVTVAIMVDGREVGRILANGHRQGLERITENATGRYAFRFDLLSPLLPLREYEITVRVLKSDYLLGPVKKLFRAINTRESGFRPLPLRPILVTTMGRSGSTLLMRHLLSHPKIVVADAKPFEVELLTYYAYALRVMTSAGDHKRSLSPDRITASENQFAIGFNPYFSAMYRHNFKQPKLFDELVSSALPERMRSCFHDMIVDYYTTVAADTQKLDPIYFAEKGLPEPLIRQVSRYLFSSVREIVLVRDLRDAVSSFMSYGSLNFEGAFDAAASSANAIMAIESTAGPDTLFVRYEDLVERPDETLRELFGFLSLDAEIGEVAHGGLFDIHATSRDVKSSMGRWKKDIGPDLLPRFERFGEYQSRFGYGEEAAMPRAAVEAALPPAAAVPAFPGTETTATQPREAGGNAALAERFESLGENCEFGLVQRRCGAEPLGLLRFASVPLERLLAALARRFEGFGDPDKLEIQIGGAGREYMVHDKAYGFLWHAWVLVSESSAEKVLQREVRRIPLLVRKFMEDLTDGEKIFVYHGMTQLPEGEIEKLSRAVLRYGRGTVLWAERATPGFQAGSVQKISPYMLKGYMDRFAPGENAHDLSLDCWVNVMRNAVDLA